MNYSYEKMSSPIMRMLAIQTGKQKSPPSHMSVLKLIVQREYGLGGILVTGLVWLIRLIRTGPFKSVVSLCFLFKFVNESEQGDSSMGIQNVAETKEEEKPPQTVKESFVKNTSQQALVSSAKRNKRYRGTCSEQNNRELKQRQQQRQRRKTVGLMSKNNRSECAFYILVHFFASSAKQQHEMTTFKALWRR